MPRKDDKNHSLIPRQPRQKRARHKVELILEAAIRLLDKGGRAALTTNAIAETAGVSIGTLYQYFPNKEAILDSLAEREVAGLSERIVAVMDDALAPQERIARIVNAIAAGYGGRSRVHRIVMEHSLGLGSRKLAPVIARLIALMTSGSRPTLNGPAPPISRADAFVAANAFVGVMRAAISGDAEDVPPQEEIVQSLARMLTRFVGQQGIDSARY